MAELYRDYFNIDPEFFPQVNEAEIEKYPDLWKKFYPHKTFVSLIKNVINVVNQREHVSLWVEGAYGTGKSHAVLTLKKLLDASEEDTRDYFNEFSRQLNNDLFNKFMQIKSGKKILTVHRYGSSDIYNDQDLCFTIQESIIKALEKAGIEYKSEGTLKESVIRWLSQDWAKPMFSALMQDEYRSLFGGKTYDELMEQLNTYEGAALQQLISKITRVGKEKGFNAIQLTVDDLVEWIKSVIRDSNLKAIVFIWDEFTEYFDNNKRALTGFQKISEISATDPFYLLIVTHNVTHIFGETNKEWKKIKDRFIVNTIELPENMAIDLMGQALRKNEDPMIMADWRDVVDSLSERTVSSRRVVEDEMKRKKTPITDEELEAILPIQPYTALMLKYISSAFNSNQRSMFDFIKNSNDDDVKGFQYFIDHYGPFDDNPLLTIDQLWNFFYEKGKDYLSPEIRSILDCYNKVETSRLMENHKRVFKAILLLQAISEQTGNAVDLFIPNDKNIGYAFEGTDLDNGESINVANALSSEGVIYKKPLKNNEFEYVALSNVEDTITIERNKKQFLKTSTENLFIDNNPLQYFNLNGYRKARFITELATVNTFNQQINKVKSEADSYHVQIPVLFTFAKNQEEADSLADKIDKVMAKDDSVIIVDASETVLGDSNFTDYAENMAYSKYHENADQQQSIHYSNLANDIIKRWVRNIGEGSCKVYSYLNPHGEYCHSNEAVKEVLDTIDRKKYPLALEENAQVNDNLWNPSNYKQGANCAINHVLKQAFSSSNKRFSIENFLGDAWKIDDYWKVEPTLYMSKLKIRADEFISERMKATGKVSITEIYNYFSEAPYGMMPCGLSGFILGFILKDYLNGSYMYSDGTSSQALDGILLVSMIDDCLKNVVTPQRKYVDKYIQTFTVEQQKFRDVVSEVFVIDKNQCSTVDRARDLIRIKMKNFDFPLWTIKHVKLPVSLLNEKDAIYSVIDDFMKLMNNVDEHESINTIASRIGKVVMEHDHLVDDLKEVITNENCKLGMQTYLDEKYPELSKLSAEISDGGRYLVTLHDNLQDNSNWLWNEASMNDVIKSIVTNYKIIAESNKIMAPQTDYNHVMREWIEKCNMIKMSYQAAKGNWGSIETLMTILYSYVSSGREAKLDKARFLEEIEKNGEAFLSYYNNQQDLFKKVNSFLLSKYHITDDEITQILQLITNKGLFVKDKSTYEKIVEEAIENYDKTRKTSEIKTLWREKTNTENPRAWSDKYSMPVLCMIPESERKDARIALNLINSNSVSGNSRTTEYAFEYISKKFNFDKLNDANERDMAFVNEFMSDYSIVLSNIDNVKNEIRNQLSVAPYEWLDQRNNIERIVSAMASLEYGKDGVEKVSHLIENMDSEQAKKYLLDLVKNNMNIGIEILKNQ